MQQANRPLTKRINCFQRARDFLGLLGLLVSFYATAQSVDINADVAISIQQTDVIWSGQQVGINLDLKTTGLSFSDIHFNLPEVAGAFLLQTDATTVKLTENIDGQSWQIIRYPLALYPQKAGSLEIPAIAVRFNSSAGFGSTKQAFEFQTKPLQLAVKSPPGVQAGDLVITTTSFQLDYHWQAASGTVHTGDALSLTVKRRARDISAMLLPPLPVFRTAGLAAYPQAPKVNDKTDRGDLTGERVDSIIWVLEKPGSYSIPGIRFQWWDPDSQLLQQQVINGQKVEVLPSQADNVLTDTVEKSEQPYQNAFWLVLVLLTVFTVLYLWQRFRPRTGMQCIDTEKTTFARLQKACRSNQPGAAYAAMHAWLVWSAPLLSSKSQAYTLSEFAQFSQDKQLSAQLKQLQEALIHPQDNWTGNELLIALRRVRKRLKQLQRLQSPAGLAMLNP